MFIFLDGSVKSFFNLELTFEDCMTIASCNTTQSEMGSCVVQYGRDPSYMMFDSNTNISFNSSSLLPLMKSSTQYYVQSRVMLNSVPIVVRTNYTTGNGKCGHLY